MEGSTTPLGRVEFDPMSVPAPRRAERGDRQSFGRSLDSARRAQDERTGSARPSRSERDDRARHLARMDEEARPPDPQSGPRAERTDAAAPAAREDAEAGSEASPTATGPAATDRPDSVARPAVRETARSANEGNTTEGSGSSHAAGAAGNKAATAGAATPAPPAGATAGAAGAAVTQAAAGASLALDGGAPAGVPARAVDVTALAPHEAVAERARPGQATVGYRTIDPHALRLGEAARDSIFRQIAMHLTPERGELRMLVDPPELGKLDLKLVVEHGNHMRLLIVAERPELAVLLDKHMAELKHSLESQGLSITGAEVRSTRDHGAGDAQGGAWGRDGFGFGAGAFAAGAGDAGLELDGPGGARRIGDGYITGDGLDFWA